MNDTTQSPRPSPIDNLFERAILDVGIPPCPGILNRFMAESSREEPDYNLLADIISSDVSLAAGLVKTANSPFFGIRQRVRTVNEALAILGLNICSRAVAGIILRNSFPNVPNLERFWDASSRIAHLGAWLAQYLKLPGLQAEDAYTYGLFRDCGIPVLLGRFPNYQKTLEAANTDAEQSFTAVEERELPTNHAMVGCILAQSWWLPEETCLAIRNHHDTVMLASAGSELPMLSRRLIATAQLAEHILQKQLGMSLTMEWPKLGDACLQLLVIDEAQLETIYFEAAPIVSFET